MYKHINDYKGKGYVPVPVNHSGIGSEVLINQRKARVVKFGQDDAYDAFIRHVQSAPCPDFPTIYLHCLPAGPFQADTNAFTLTEMEPLVHLTDEEAPAVIKWYDDVISALAAGDDPLLVSDPFGLTARLLELREVAERERVGLDMGKSSNYMVRVSNNGRRKVVITDPFG